MTAPLERSAARTAPAALFARAEATPHTVGMRVLESGVWAEYSWFDVARTVSRIAALLDGAGVAAGSTVAMACGSRAEWPLGVWAANALGATVVAVTAQADDATVAAVQAHQPVVWMVEGAEPLDRLERTGVHDIPVLALTDPDRGGLGAQLWSWQQDVVQASDDDQRTTLLQAAADELDPDSVALVLPEENDASFTHAQLMQPDRSEARLGFEAGDEYLAFLPPTWVTEAPVLLGEHVAAGATVNSGSRSTSGIAELSAVQPTALQAPAQWWEALAARLTRSATEPAPLARAPLQTIIGGGTGGGPMTKLARRSIKRRFGLHRLREARSIGPIPEATQMILNGLQVPMHPALAVPVSLHDSGVDVGEGQSESLEGAK